MNISSLTFLLVIISFAYVAYAIAIEEQPTATGPSKPNEGGNVVTKVYNQIREAVRRRFDSISASLSPSQKTALDDAHKSFAKMLALLRDRLENVQSQMKPEELRKQTLAKLDEIKANITNAKAQVMQSNLTKQVDQKVKALFNDMENYVQQAKEFVQNVEPSKYQSYIEDIKRMFIKGGNGTDNEGIARRIYDSATGALHSLSETVGNLMTSFTG